MVGKPRQDWLAAMRQVRSLLLAGGQSKAFRFLDNGEQEVDMIDEVHEACGIFGIYAPGEDVARITFFGLHALQHRGQESAGIASAYGTEICLQAGMGLVSQVFDDEDKFAQLKGNIAIGHNRYSTTGSSRICNAQPIVLGKGRDAFALGHNGNLVNAEHLRDSLVDEGQRFLTSTDSEVIGRLIMTTFGHSFVDKIRRAMPRMSGAYSLVIMTPDQLIGVRDPFGVRPMCVGKLNGGWVLASESCALDNIGAQFIREVEPGEIVAIDDSGLQSYTGQPSARQAICIFEYSYFARPDSVIRGRLVHLARQAMGANLAKEHPVEADLVIAVPDSATAAGIGYSRATGIPFSEGLLKNRYVHRTFIQPDQRLRDAGAQLKYNPLPEILQGQRIVVVDDSIVRGTTTPRVVNLLRRAGAAEIHMRICVPPIRFPCFFGVDMATRRELIAAWKSVEDIRDFIGADSLGYLSLDGLIDAVGSPKNSFCTACFTGDYPMAVQLELDKLALERSDGLVDIDYQGLDNFTHNRTTKAG